MRPRNAAKDSHFARQYLDQGFVLLGKTRLPDFGFSATTEYAGAPATRNPWAPGYSSGAPGGSAALVAAGAVLIAHGNDGGGSIRIPAACCGLMGLKPTRGRLVKSEARWCRSTSSPRACWPPIGRVEGPGRRRRLRVGLVMDSITGSPTCPQTRAVVEDAGHLLAGLGHRVEEAPVPLERRFIDDFVLYYGFMAFMVSTFGRALFGPGFDPRQLDGLTRGLSRYYRRKLWKTPAVLYQLKRTWQAYARSFQQYDVVLSPVLAHTTPPLGYLSPNVDFEVLIDRLIKYVSFTPANNASGSPALSLLLGESREGLPIGVQPALQGDETLLELAFELEQARQRRIQNRRDGHLETGFIDLIVTLPGSSGGGPADNANLDRSQIWEAVDVSADAHPTHYRTGSGDSGPLPHPSGEKAGHALAEPPRKSG